jgi:hypothetical protein
LTKSPALYARRSVKLFYDPRDDLYHEKLGSEILHWLDDVGACPRTRSFATALPSQSPFFGWIPCFRPSTERVFAFLHLVPGFCPLDEPLPEDLTFPLFLRTTSPHGRKVGGYRE